MDITSDRSSRTRKSAPIKNNSFVGAKYKASRKTESSTNDDHVFITPARRTRQTDRSLSHSRMRFSTPVRKCETEPRQLRPRQKSGSTMSITSTGSVRRFHPKYDPTIELRRAKERFEKYKSDDWLDDMFLHEDTSKDLSKYEAKVKIRDSINSSASTSASEMIEDGQPAEIEKRITELRRRQRDIDRGKITEKYAEYVYAVPKPERQPWHPQTPNKFRIVSRRAWDGMIKKWRKHIHSYEDHEFSICYRSDSSSISGLSSSRSDFSIDEEIAEPANMIKLMEEDEDTVTHPLGTFKSSVEEEETLQGAATNDQENMKPLRRSTRKKSGNSSGQPTPDVLHCGLTNDMNNLVSLAGSKRTMETMPAVKVEPTLPQSPSKRQRRNSSGVRGVLAKHGQHVLRPLNN